MKDKKQKLELKKELGTPVPTSSELGTTELGTRIRDLQKQIGTVEYAAEVAGVNAETLNRWMKGTTKASFMGVARLALTAGKSLDWVATGEGPQEQQEMDRPKVVGDPSMPYAFNVRLEWIRNAVEAVELMGKDAPADRKAVAVERAYMRLAETEGEADMLDVMRIIQAALKG